MLDLSSRGVDVVGELPSAVPDPAWPDVSWRDAVDLLPAALGVLLLSAEAIGVTRTLAAKHRYRVDTNRDLIGLGGSNLLAGLSSGFVQSGGASQTMAVERGGGRTQLASLVAAGLILLTGAFFAFLFEDLPEATLGAIVVVAIFGLLPRRRAAALRPDQEERAAFLALLALTGRAPLRRPAGVDPRRRARR